MKRNNFDISKVLTTMSLAILMSCANVNTDKDVVKSYYDNGKIKSELRYKDGKLNGECAWYYSNGSIRMRSHYDMNVLSGETTMWYENGNIQSRYFCKENEYDSIFESYNVDGKLVKKEYYKSGVKHGPLSQWYDKGNIFVVGQYEDGMFEGEWKIYYENGSLGSEAEYDNGAGVQIGYAPDGTKVAMIHYRDNVKDGEEILYNRDGTVREILLWSEGEYVGKKE